MNGGLKDWLPQAQTVLAGIAMMILGVMGIIMEFFRVPEGNNDHITYVLGALSGALTVGGVSKVAQAVHDAGEKKANE